MADSNSKISKKLVDLQRLVIPEISTLIELRYNILSTVKSEAPIGRRNLAYVLDMSERQVRNEIDFLQEQKLMEVERQGIILTPLGNNILDDLKQMLYTYNGLEQLENQLVEALHLKKAVVCPGDMKINYQVLNFMGKAAANVILTVMKYQDVLALTGGASTAAVAAQMKEALYPDAYVIPARGGIGKSHATQANNVVAEIALKLRAKYELLHLPDNIDRNLLEALKDYPEIKRVFDKMKEIDVLVFGIGRADVLADSRNTPPAEKEALLNRGAIGEAFGYYFDAQGQVIQAASTVGVDIEDYPRIANRIGIAGSKAKAEAIIGACRVAPETILITDESAATEIIRLLNK
ncbi:sugar-binding transcriptional regulator [Pseudoramibacter alactolyticus]|jgi:central glycolytic genes regulator